MSGTATPFIPRDYGPPTPGIDGLIATGSVQADASPISKKINVYSVVASGTGASLPTSFEPGAHIVVLNRGANDLKVYPSKGDQIEGYGIDQFVVVAAGGGASFWNGAQPVSPKPRVWWLTP